VNRNHSRYFDDEAAGNQDVVHGPALLKGQEYRREVLKILPESEKQEASDSPEFGRGANWEVRSWPNGRSDLAMARHDVESRRKWPHT